MRVQNTLIIAAILSVGISSAYANVASISQQTTKSPKATTVKKASWNMTKQPTQKKVGHNVQPQESKRGEEPKASETRQASRAKQTHHHHQQQHRHTEHRQAESRPGNVREGRPTDPDYSFNRMRKFMGNHH